MGVRKFKLKKEYPGSPKLGSECTQLENDTITAYPEYWEEIIEKDYEILSFLGDGKNIAEKNEYGTFTYKSNGHTGTEEKFIDLIKRKDVVIHSIRRISDREVFTIGDRIEYIYLNSNGIKICKYYLIEKIYILNEDGIRLYVGSGLNLGLKNISKSKKLILTTFDGVDIYEGDKYFTVYDCDPTKYINWKTQPVPFTATGKTSHYVFENIYYFSTKAAAEDYIFNNKPCLSYNEVSEIYKNYLVDFGRPFTFNLMLINKVKQKLK